MNLPITVGVPTKDRYEALAICLTSIAFQTEKPSEVIIVDDSDNPKNITEIPNFQYILELFNYYRISWRVIWGLHKGQVTSHSIIQEEAKNPWIFRIDDDCMAEPNVLEELYGFAENTPNLGAVGCSILMPNPQIKPKGLPYNSIHDLNSPNIQWFIWNGWNEVDHLNSSFLYRKGVAEYSRALSKVGHREETIFTHEIKRAGFVVAATGHAKIWHFRQSSGGIRSYPDPSLYESDDRIFQQLLKSWNYQEPDNEKVVVLDSGIGDHYAFKHVLKDLRKKYSKITIAACYPDVFFDEEPGLNIISIAEAKMLFGDLGRWCVYTKMKQWKHGGGLVSAYNKLYNEDIHALSVKTNEVRGKQEQSKGLPLLRGAGEASK